MNGVGISHSAISVLNAIPCGVGAVIGIDLVTQAHFRPGTDDLRIKIDNAPSADTGLAAVCVRRALERAGSDVRGGVLNITSQIPISKGLKSSSAAANAILMAVLHSQNMELPPLELLRLGTNCAREAGVTVTGAFDDACGCLLGGFIMTDNRKDEIIIAKDVDVMDVILHIPDESIMKKDPRLDALRSREGDVWPIVELAKVDHLRAMTLNGALVAETLGLSNIVAEKALSMGALAAGISGTGPATAILCQKGEGRGFMREMDEENLILANTRRLEDGPVL